MSEINSNADDLLTTSVMALRGTGAQLIDTPSEKEATSRLPAVPKGSGIFFELVRWCGCSQMRPAKKNQQQTAFPVSDWRWFRWTPTTS